MIPEIMPLKKGAPEASEIPKQRGSATKNTTTPEGRSYLNVLNMRDKIIGERAFYESQNKKEEKIKLCLKAVKKD